jgi:hypothetical protein
VDRRARSIGVGVFRVGSTLYWAQWFSATKPKAAVIVPNAAVSSPVKVRLSGYVLSVRVSPSQRLALGERVRLTACLKGPDSFKRTVVAPDSLRYAVSGDGAGKVSSRGILVGLEPGPLSVEVRVRGAPTLAASADLRVTRAR